jgi:hypothetical protein
VSHADSRLVARLFTEDFMAKKRTTRPSPAFQIQPPVHVYKVALKGQPTTWRRIEVSSTQTLDDLHQAIFEAFDRDDEHLYAFYFPAPGARGRRALLDAVQYLHPEGVEFEEEGVHDASVVRLHELDLHPGRTFEYEFDFGDSWWHVITFEGERPAEPKAKYPRVVESKGKSPPQYPGEDDEFDD